MEEEINRTDQKITNNGQRNKQNRPKSYQKWTNELK